MGHIDQTPARSCQKTSPSLQAPPEAPPPFTTCPRGAQQNHPDNPFGEAPEILSDSSKTPSFPSQVSHDECDAPVPPPQCLRSVRAHHIADLLGGLPPARYGPGRKYLETDRDNPIPWAVTDALYERVHCDATALRQERQWYLNTHARVLPPQSPPHRRDFGGQRPDGDPPRRAARNLPRDGALWPAHDHDAFVAASMAYEFPPNVAGVVATRAWSAPREKALQDLQPELDAIVAARVALTRRYEAFHGAWSGLQAQLMQKANELRAEYARVMEHISCLHHQFVRARISKYQYQPVREMLNQQMRDIFDVVGQVAQALGLMYAEGRAVAQGVRPDGGIKHGKLDVAACNAVPYLRSVFPEFVKAKAPANPIPADPMAPEPYMLAFKGDMLTHDFHELMDLVWEKYPTKLQDIHQAVFRDSFEGVEELTQIERTTAEALLGCIQ